MLYLRCARQRADEMVRKQEEKEAKLLRLLHSRNNSEYELQHARERDPQSTKERRKSLIGATAPPIAFPQPATMIYPNHTGTATGYPPSPYGHGYGNVGAGYAGSGGHSRSASVGTYDVAKHMKDMDLNRGERERKVSIGGTRVYGAKDASPYERTRTISGNLSDRPNPYPSPPGIYSSASGAYGNPIGQYPSPNIRPRDFAYGTAGSTGYPPASLSSSPGHSAFGSPLAGGYPPGHVLYDPLATNQPRSRAPSRPASRPASRAASRAPSPNPGSSRYYIMWDSCY